MKIIKTLILSLLLLALSSFILSLTLTILSSFIEKENIISILKEVCTLTIFFFIAMFIAKRIGSKGLVIAILLSSIYLLSLFISSSFNYNLLSILITLSKILAIFSGSIIGVNI